MGIQEGPWNTKKKKEVISYQSIQLRPQNVNLDLQEEALLLGKKEGQELYSFRKKR